MTPSQNHLIVFDTETTGLIQNSAKPLKDQPKIIELYAAKLDINDGLKQIDEWHSLFFSKDVTDEVTKITGITRAMLTNEPMFAQKVDSLAEFYLGSRWMVGHNLSFDRDMLWMELRRLGMGQAFPWPPRQLCTVEATEGLEGFRMGLSVLHERVTGTTFDGAHRAKSDVGATAAALRKLVEDGTVKL